jgi:ABC-type glycerol-3-phosphate transport system substrate-binding protein
MKTLLKFLLVPLAAVLLAVLTGCVPVAAGAAGAGTVAWMNGRLDATLESDFESVVKATNAAIKDLQFAKISENKDALEAILIVRTAADKKIEIKIFKVADKAAKVQIRVGFFGDQPLELTFLDKIKGNL